MCPPEIAIKSEEVDDGFPDLACCDHLGAKAGNAVPEPLTPSKGLDQVRPKLKYEDDGDDVLTSLCALFDGMWPDSAEDDSDTESDCSSPRSKAFDLSFPIRTYFTLGNCIYFFDEDHNVFSQDQYGNHVMIHQGQPLNLNDMLQVDFIEGLPCYFGLDGNLWYADQSTSFQVDTWIDQTLSPTFSPAPNVFESSLSFIPDGFGLPEHSMPVSNGAYCNTKAETKVEADQFKPNPLHGSLQGQGGMPWSPGSSAMSPIVASGSRASSESLEPLITTDTAGWLGSLWKQETEIIQHQRNTEPIDIMKRRRCPSCQKVFRRPSSLDDHLNVHTGNKPHICPYERCNTGFATKSNMKRHFATHRVGALETYARSGKSLKAKSLTTTYNAKAFHTQRFRLNAGP